MTVTTWDHSTWVAKRAQDAQQLGPPPTPEHVTLPGAKAAVRHDRLLAYQQAGHDHHAIAARVNARWHEENRERLEAARAWVHGPYRDAIREMRQREMERAAEEQRRRAIFEEILAEREGR